MGIPQPRGASCAAPAQRPALAGSPPADRDWVGWWTPVRPPAPEGTGPSHPPRYAGAHPVAAPATAAQPPAGGGIAGSQLSRRVPQANLAPELRRTKPAGEVVAAEPVAAEPVAAGNAAAPGDAQRARAALSRYQASRLAALHEQADARSRS